jgi:hypothetical protein
LRGSSPVTGWLLAVALGAGGCSTKTLVAVDPYPCGDAGASGCASLLDGLVGWWRLDDPDGSATARDWSSWGNDGTLAGLDPSTAWVTGGPEGRAFAAQAKGYFNVAASSSIDSVTDQITVAAWMYLNGTIAAGSYATAISRQIGTGYGQTYHLSITDTQHPGLFVTTTTGGQLDIVAAATVPQNSWVHLAGTFDGAMTHLYLNGVEVNTGALTGSLAPETNPVVLGGNGNTDSHAVSEQIPGELDEIMLYRRALSAGEVARLAGGALLPAGLHLDGGSGGD